MFMSPALNFRGNSQARPPSGNETKDRADTDKEKWTTALADWQSGGTIGNSLANGLANSSGVLKNRKNTADAVVAPSAAAKKVSDSAVVVSSASAKKLNPPDGDITVPVKEKKEGAKNTGKKH